MDDGLLWLLLLYLPSRCWGVQRVPGLPTDCYNEQGDLNLAFMVKVSGKGQDGMLCTGDLYSEARVKYVEALIYSIRQINAQQDLLPNTTLGFVIMDTCGRDLACLGRATYLIPDPTDTNTQLAAPGMMCTAQRYEVIGVVGPSTSREAVLLSSLMSIFKIPVVADFSTSDELSDKSRFEYYLRLVPPDRFQAKAMIDLLLYFEWTYAFLLYSEGSYGENAGKLTIADAKRKGVCFAVAQVVSSVIKKVQVEELLTSLVQNGRARALILFLEPFHLDMVMDGIRDLGYRGYFMIIGGDTMSDTDYGAAADGSMVIHFTGSRVPEFEDYYLQLTPVNNPNNPWMHDLWQDLYGCTWDPTDTSKQSCVEVENKPYTKQDVGEKISTVMDGPRVFALGIHDLVVSTCPQAFSDKALLKQCVTGETLLPYLRNVSFPGYSTGIKFDAQGDMIGSYSIRQYLHNASKVFVEVAVWEQETDSIRVLEEDIRWEIYKKTTPTPIPESLCSYPCKAKEYSVRRDLSCCWDCKICRQNEILVENFTACEVCPINNWPDMETQTYCEQIPPTYILWSDTVAAGLMFVGCLGLFLVTATIVVFINQRNNRLIKASSRELSAIILVGIFLAYATIFFYIAKPDLIMCAINRYGFNLTITFIYAPLLVKTNRIFRIFAAGKKGTKKPTLIDSRAQLIICTMLLLIQVMIVVATGILALPEAKLRMPVITEKYVELSCFQSLSAFLPSLAFNLFLIILCAIYGFLTRKLPANFNESWYIFVSVATTTFLLMVFLPAYFTAFYAVHQVVLLAACLFIVPSVTLLCLYFPKIYAIYFVDETKMDLGTTNVAPTNVTSITSTET